MHGNTGEHRKRLDELLESTAERMSRTRLEQWGVFDTLDNCWIGDDDGPKLFESTHPMTQHLGGSKKCAQLSAQIIGVQLGFEPNRLQARLYTQPATKLRDEVATKMTTVTALKRIEEGGAV